MRYVIITSVFLNLCLILFGVFVFYKSFNGVEAAEDLSRKTLMISRQLQMSTYYSRIETLPKIGLLKLGGQIPYGAGDFTLAPYNQIPKSKFYVFMAGDDWCILESCGIEGNFVQTMGGWLGGENIEQPEIAEDFGLDDSIRKYNSVIIVGDANEKVVGIYPNATIKNLFSILKQHPDLADFSLLMGVDKFGSLKLGNPSPIRPGDFLQQFKEDEFIKTGYRLSDKEVINRLPKHKKFYIFGFEKTFMEKPFCAYLDCFEFGHFEYTRELGGWFSGTNDYETIEQFGLNPQKVNTGEQSLLIVMDPNGLIVAIHPNKKKEDVLSVLWQLPQLAIIE